MLPASLVRRSTGAGTRGNRGVLGPVAGCPFQGVVMIHKGHRVSVSRSPDAGLRPGEGYKPEAIPKSTAGCSARIKKFDAESFAG